MTEPKKVTDHAFVPPPPVKPKPSLWGVFRRHSLLTWVALAGAVIWTLALPFDIARGDTLNALIHAVLIPLYLFWARNLWRGDVAKHR